MMMNKSCNYSCAFPGSAIQFTLCMHGRVNVVAPLIIIIIYWVETACMADMPSPKKRLVINCSAIHPNKAAYVTLKHVRSSF